MPTERNARVWVMATGLLMAVGVVFVAIGILYFVVPSKSLPSFVPGHSAWTGHHNKRAIAALAVGVVAFGATWVSSRARRAKSPQGAV